MLTLPTNAGISLPPQYTATSLSGNRTSILFINFIVESYNYTVLNVTAGYSRTQYEAQVLAAKLRYNMSWVNKLVYNAAQVSETGPLPFHTGNTRSSLWHMPSTCGSFPSSRSS